jgi:D-3-phosphoglycerate dehydrogenase
MDEHMHQRKWTPMTGVLLSEKTIGLIGCGRIGSYVAKLATAFGCTMLGHDPFLPEHKYCKLLPLQQVLEMADIISLHFPYTPENHHFIGKKQLNRMKSSAIFVNTARGKVVDERALVDVLQQGVIAGAALDVFEAEPYQGPLMDLPAEKVLLTPHAASSAKETRIQMEQETVDNLIQGLKECGLTI